MANKRQLKKTINMVTGDLLVECIATKYINKESRQEDVDNVMVGILRMQDDFICRVSHPEPGMPAKQYFKALRDDLAKQADAIVNQLYAIV
ncbi:MAG: hypothetical protein UHL07_08295 [Bacteroidaceae bacterium]|nr:hypothetical protein [Bacteroidaceae bacterium]